MPLCRMGQQFKAIAMRRNDLTNAPDKVAIWREPATGKQCLKLSHKLVELADQARNSINWMKRIGHARLTPELGRAEKRLRLE